MSLAFWQQPEPDHETDYKTDYDATDQKDIDSEHQRNYKAILAYYAIFSTPAFKEYSKKYLSEDLQWITSALCKKVKDISASPNNSETVEDISTQFRHLNDAYQRYQQHQQFLAFSRKMTAILTTNNTAPIQQVATPPMATAIGGMSPPALKTP